MNSKSVGASLVFKLTERIAVKAIGFVISVLLARLLDPDIFGIVAIITAVITLTQTFVDSGMATALIQNKDTTRSDYSTMFYIAMGIAAAVYFFLFFTAPIITEYYDIPEYLIHFRVLALTLLFYAFNSIQAAKLTREMQFKKMLICQLVASVLSGIIGVGLAYAGYGIWALIVYYLASSAITCLAYGVVAKWHPEWVFSVSRAKELFGYGYKILVSGLLCSVFNNLRTFVIGKCYTKAELGLYSRGNQIPSIISSSIDSAFLTVMLPAFSKNQDDPEKIRRMLKKTIELDSYLNFPAMLGLAAVAPTAVVAIYSQKWEACIPYVQLLSLASLVVSIYPSCLVAIKALGRSDVYLKLETVRRVIMVAILVISLFFQSLIAIAVGWVISCVIDTLVILVPTRKLVGYTLGDMIADTFPSLAMALVMAAVVWCVGLLDLNVYLLLVLQVVCGAGVYMGISAMLKNRSYQDLKARVKGFFKK